MNVKRAAPVVVVGGALAVWLTGAATSINRDLTSAPIVKSEPLDVGGAKLADEIARLHDRLRPTEAPRGGRNLFRFAGAKPRSALPVASPAPIQAVAAPLAPPRPALRLIGIAEDAQPNGVVRTAIISGASQLLIVKEGDAATSRFRVVKISVDVVELTDTIDGTTLRLALP
jgi:hypothetical protein